MKHIKTITMLKEEILRRGSVLRSTFLTILTLLLTLSVAFQLILYRNTYHSLRSSASESSAAFLTMVSKLADENFSQLCDAADSLAWDETTLNAVLFPDLQNHPRNFEIVRQLKSFTTGEPYITRVTLLCGHDGSAYSSDGQVGMLYELDGGADFSAKKLSPLGSSTDAYLLRTESGEVCLYYPFIPCSLGHLGELLLYLDTDAIFSEICGDDRPICVYAGEETLLYSNSNVIIRPDNGQENVQVCRSAEMDLSFCHAFSPASLSIGKVLTSNQAGLIFAAILLLIVAVSLLVAWRFYSPLRTALQTLQAGASGEENTEEGQTDWDTLNRSIQTLNRDTVQFRGIAEMISPYLRRQLLTDLLNGVSMDADSLRQILVSIDATLPPEGRRVLFVTVNSVTGVFNSAAIEHTIRSLENLDMSGYTLYSFPYQYSIVTIACAYNDQAVSEGRIADLAHAIRVFTHNLPNSKVLVSECFTDLMQLREVYQQLVTNSQVNNAEDISPENIEQRIRQTVQTLTDRPEEAAGAMVAHMLTTIRQADLAQEETIRCCRVLADALYGLSRTYHAGVSAPPDITGRTPDPAFFEELSDYLQHIVREIFANLDNRQRKYLTAAQEYVDAHYMDSGLSLNVIAEHLGISPSYLSRIFSEMRGIRFTQYLNDLRIEKAKELLADENRLIRDISQEVGFLTIQSFMRNFKAKTGVTPGEYRSALLRRSE